MRHAWVGWVVGAMLLVACGDDEAAATTDTVADSTGEVATETTIAPTGVTTVGDATGSPEDADAVTAQPEETVAGDSADTGEVGGDDGADVVGDVGGDDGGDVVDPQAEEHSSNVNAFVRVLNGGDLPVTVSFNAASALAEFSEIQKNDLSTGAWRGFTEVPAGTLAVKVVSQIGNYDPGLGNTPETIERTFTVQANKRYVIVTNAHDLLPTMSNPGGSFGPMFHWNVGLFMEADPASDGTVPVLLISTSSNETQATFKLGATTLGTVAPVASNFGTDGSSVITAVAASGTKLLVHTNIGGEGGPEFALPDLIPNRPAILIDRDGTLGVATLGGPARYLHPLARVRVLNLLTTQAAPGGSLWFVPDDASLTPTGFPPVLVAADVPALGFSGYATIASGPYLPWRWFATATATPGTTTPTSGGTIDQVYPTIDQTVIVANVGTGRAAAGLPESGILAFNTGYEGGGNPAPTDAAHANVEIQSALYDSLVFECGAGDGTGMSSSGLSALGAGQARPTAAQTVGFHCAIIVGATTTTYAFTPAVGRGYRLYVSDSDVTGKGHPFAVLLSDDGTLTTLQPSP